MEKETVNQENEIMEKTEKTFSQSELDAIIADRLKREREKYADYNALKEKASKFDEMEEANKSELQKATERAEKLAAELDAMKQADSVRSIREKVSKATGVPADMLTFADEESCTKQAQAILDFNKPSAYPQVRDGGEVQNVGELTTKQQFSAWLQQSI